MYHIIVNPSARSGRGRKNWEKVKHILDTQNVEYEVLFTTQHGDASAFAKDLYEKYAMPTSPLELVVLGGDGSINEVVQGLPSFDNVALSCIPVGSSNDLARALLPSSTLEESVLHLINKPTTLYMDLGIVHMENSLVREGNMSIPDRRFLVSCGIGYDASVCQEALSSALKNFLNRIKLGKLSYLAICLKQVISMKPVSAELFLDDSENPVSIKNLVFLVGMNNRYEGGGFMFAPEANNHDGVLDTLIVSNIAKARILLRLPSALKGEHLRYNGIDLQKAYTVRLRTSKPLWVHTDGEVESKADYIEMRILKEALRFVY